MMAGRKAYALQGSFMKLASRISILVGLFSLLAGVSTVAAQTCKRGIA